MKHICISALLVMMLTCQNGRASVLEWFWKKDTDDTTVLVADGVPLISIPYESMTEDEKFLQEASKFTEIQTSSPLETCQHKVIMKIKTSCTAMTEEELAKLSVNLLNCQSAVEGRKMFPCTEEMSLKQCTTDMDADMWNAYHLMSNRARAVCYAARSTQFRALTELTVNKLMQTAHTQIKTLSSLKEGQDRLEEQTVEALSSLSEGNKALLEQQQHLRDAQASAHNLVSTNLRELSSERALIRSGHAQLAAMTEDLRNKLEQANRNLEQQAIERGENHREILEDLMSIQEQAQVIWDKLESSTNRIFTQHEEALLQYEQTLQKLAQINETIQYVWNITNTMRAEVDEKLNWLTNYIGDTGDQMHRMYRAGLHIVYLLLAMVTASFLHAPLLTRITIMGLVPLNLLSYLKHGMDACLDFTSLTALIFLITTMHFVMIGIQRLCGLRSRNIRPEPVQVMNTNGHMNGTSHSYVSSSYSNLATSRDPSVSLYAKLKNSIRQFYNFVRYEINLGIQKCSSLMQSIASWSKQSLTQREELSCSYIPSRRNREDLVHSYEREFPSMSEDVTDFENSNIINGRNESIDDLDKLTDAHELRLRLKRRTTRSPRSHARSPTRSVTSSSDTPSRILCNAITKTGSRCRIAAMNDHIYCYRHVDGSSLLGD
ncbi:protein brambleberry [Megachile rotundata]|uniref:protein brambleberry n=1 Tax=Megachile rotundata TaxID=143995 RepID=UPI000614CC9C|nr:PREDICTED: protein brambleberry-like [Megachile rotundata]XP_012135756.1 PREDICTED: protein brambleberry-like [Megachile rotundata]